MIEQTGVTGYKSAITVYLIIILLISVTYGFAKKPGLTTGTITASANSICPGTNIVFTALPVNATYLWYVNGVANSITTNVFSTNTLKDNDQVSCYITDVSGGAFSNAITIAVGLAQAPAVNITASMVDICTGTPVTFTATAINGGPSPVYQWKVNGLSVGNNSNTYTSSNFNNNDAVTCIMVSSAPCIVPAPVSSYTIFMNVSAVLQPKGNILATANTVCAGMPVDFSMNMSIGTPVSYQWKVNGNNISNNSSFNISTLNNQDMISCDMLVNTRCTVNVPFSSSFTINVMPIIVAAKVNITASAIGTCPAVPVTFTASTLNAGNNIHYQWKVNNINAGPDSYIFTTAALNNNDAVTCQVTSANVPCLLSNVSVSNVLTSIIYPLPLVSLPAIQTVTSGNSITLNPVVTGNINQYIWSPATGLSSTSVKNPVASPNDDITYTLTVVSSAGCTGSGTTSVKVSGVKIQVNNTFTPNADGINDTWVIPGLANYDTCMVDIFNRYGENVFHSVGYPLAWAGNFNNKPLPAGVYYYIINLKDGSQPLTGHLTLIR